MPKKGYNYYGVAVGRIPGVYQDWASTEEQTKKFPGAKYKGFRTKREAEEFVAGSSTATIPIPAVPSTATNVSTSAPYRFSLAWKDGWYGACDLNGHIIGNGGAESMIDALVLMVVKLDKYEVLEVYHPKENLNLQSAPELRRKKITEFLCKENFEPYEKALLLCNPVHPQTLLALDWYQKSTAVLIGIDNYPKQAQLSYCANDARSMQTCLDQRGFSTTLLLNEAATKQAIQTALFKYDKEGWEGRFLLYFAGHGSDRLKAILPFDFDPENDRATCLPMGNFGWPDFHKLMPKHFLLVLDTCYSAHAASVRGQNVHQLADHLQKPAREVFTAGQSDQKAREDNGHGCFTQALINGLNGEAYPPGESWITTAGLASYVQKSMAAYTQTPQHFRLFDGESDGSFIFEHPRCQT